MQKLGHDVFTCEFRNDIDSRHDSPSFGHRHHTLATTTRIERLCYVSHTIQAVTRYSDCNRMIWHIQRATKRHDGSWRIRKTADTKKRERNANIWEEKTSQLINECNERTN